MIDAVGQSDVGRRRKLNEDSFYVNDEEGFFAVCDGMGGHNAGEIASRMAVETLAAFIQRSDRETEITWPYGLDVNLSFAGNRLTTAIRLANKRVFRAADSREEYTGMGTTVVAALVTERMLAVGSAGDSRCYLVRNESLTQLTKDDSWVAVARSEGILGPDDAERHPFRNVITKAVGAKETIDVQIVERSLEAGDLILLCSDGLHGMLTDDQIRSLLVPCPEDLEEAVKRMIVAANEAGGRDNVTVVLVRIS
jgi:serine/threonine protein phosphatase PrpC